MFGKKIKKNKLYGFTIIEMMVVATLVLILCSMSIPIFLTKKTETVLLAELEKIGTIMIYLRQQAMASNQELQLTLDTKKNVYSFLKDNHPFSYSLASPVCFGFLPGTYGPPANPTAPIEHAITFPQRENCAIVKFFPTGSITSGTLYLTDKKHVIGALTCNVAQVSYIRKYMYRNQRWNLINEGNDCR